MIKMGLFKDGSCKLCGSKGNTTNVIFATYCAFSYCNNHSEEEIKAYKQIKKQEYLIEKARMSK